MTSLCRWFANYEWTYDTDIDPALYSWRMRWYESSNNPFGRSLRPRR